MIPRVPGTTDTLDMSAYLRIIATIRTELAHACFTEVRTPIIEHRELFQRTLGTHTDVVNKEMYLVTTAHEQEAPSLCLRPEGTAPIMRAYLNGDVTARPWRAFMAGPFFRHERPQKGRYRQFEQVTIEVIGAQSHLYDVQLIALLDRIFSTTFRLSEYGLLLNYMGCVEDRAKFRATLIPFLEKNRDALCPTCHTRMTHNPMRVFDCKQATCQAIYEKTPRITDALCAPCATAWSDMQSTLLGLGVSFHHEPRLVRGLDYYGKTVFEFVSRQLGAQSTFCAGGRYDQLAQELGSAHEIPAVGGAIGVERLSMLCELAGTTPSTPKEPLIAILPLTADERILGLHILQELHVNSCHSDIFLEDAPIKKKFRWANDVGAAVAIIIGPDERTAGVVKLKHMESGTEETVAHKNLPASIMAMLHQGNAKTT